MKTFLFVLSLTISMLQSIAQVQPAVAPPGQRSTPRPEALDLPRFDLDFPGGSPQALVDALNMPLHGTLNVVITAESQTADIPPLKLKSVNVAQVFDGLQRAS